MQKDFYKGEKKQCLKMLKYYTIVVKDKRQ